MQTNSAFNHILNTSLVIHIYIYRFIFTLINLVLVLLKSIAWNKSQNVASQLLALQPNKALHKSIYKLSNLQRLNSYKTLARIDNQTRNTPARYMLTRDLAEFTKLHNTKLYGVRLSGDLTKSLLLQSSHGNLRHGKKANEKNG